MSDLLDRAFVLHATIKDRIRRAILRREPMDPDQIWRDDLCEFGDWIRGEGGRKYGRDPLFPELKKAHAEFHFAAYNAYCMHSFVHEDILKSHIESGEFLEKSNAIIRLIAKMKVGSMQDRDGARRSMERESAHE